MTFQSLGLSEDTQQALEAHGYHSPTPVQMKAIPAVLQGKDVLVTAQTGTGKTVSYVAPLLDLLNAGSAPNSNRIYCLILVPTRELAVQVHQAINVYSVKMPIISAVVYGGVKINPQMMSLRQGVHILVATPGRLIDLYEKQALKFDQLKTLVLDEADRMLSLGFSDEVNQVLDLLPKRRQTLMFSATVSPLIKTLAGRMLQKPVEINISPEQIVTRKVNQWLVPVDKKRKAALLAFLLSKNNDQQTLVFVNTKKDADKLVSKLTTDGQLAAAIHGDKSQALRMRHLNEFKTGQVKVLVATDVASRGLDIGKLPVVINVDLPKVAEDYVHRIGRTGRANEAGDAISLVSADEFEKLRNIEQLIREVIVREYVDSFQPNDDLPVSDGVPPPRKPKKPKKPKKGKLMK